MAETKITNRQKRFSGGKWTTNKSVPDIGWATNDTFTEVYDTDGYKVGTKFTAPFDGKYLFIANAEYASNGTGHRGLSLRLNGSTFRTREINNATTGQVSGISIAEIFDLTAGDYLEYLVFQTSGGNLALNSPQSNLEIVRLA